MLINDAQLFGLTLAQTMEMEKQNALAVWPFPRVIGLGPSCTLPPATEEDLKALREAAEEAQRFMRRAEEACRQKGEENDINDTAQL